MQCFCEAALDSALAGDMISRSLGSVAGMLIALYPLGKIIEWVLLKHVLNSYGAIVLISPSIFSILLVLWILSKYRTNAFNPVNFFTFLSSRLYCQYCELGDAIKRKEKDDS